MNIRQTQNFGRLNKLLDHSGKSGLKLIASIIKKILLDDAKNPNRNDDVKETDRLIGELKKMIEREKNKKK